MGWGKSAESPERRFEEGGNLKTEGWEPGVCNNQRSEKI